MPDLFASPVPVPREAPGLRYLVGLDIHHPSFVRLAALRIAQMADPGEVEAALHEVPAPVLPLIETLTVTGIAFRIAQLPTLEGRRAALALVPSGLIARIEPHVLRFYGTKPWLRKRDG